MSNVSAAFIPIYFLCTFFGIMPWEYQFGRKDPTTGSIPIKLRTTKLIFSIVLLLATLLHGLSAPVYILQTRSPQDYPGDIFTYHLTNKSLLHEPESKQSLIMKVLDPILVTLMSLSARVVAVYSLKVGLKKYFDNIDHVDQFLKQMHSFKDIVSPKKHFLFGVAIAFVFAVLGFPVNAYYLCTVVKFNNAIGNIWSAILVWSSLTGFCGDILFVFSAYLVRIRFTVINETLNKIGLEETEAAHRSLEEWASCRRYS